MAYFQYEETGWAEVIMIVIIIVLVYRVIFF